MPRRRAFLMSLAALAALVAPIPGARLSARTLPVRRYGRMYVVNGWILTAADVEALQRHL